MAREDGGTTAAAVVLILLAVLLAALAVAGVLPALIARILAALQGAQAAPDRLQPTKTPTSGTGRRQAVRQTVRQPTAVRQPADLPDVVPGEPNLPERQAAPPAYPPVPNGGLLLPQPLIDRILRDLRIPVPPGLEGGVPSEAGG